MENLRHEIERKKRKRDEDEEYQTKKRHEDEEYQKKKRHEDEEYQKKKRDEEEEYQKKKRDEEEEYQKKKRDEEEHRKRRRCEEEKENAKKTANSFFNLFTLFYVMHLSERPRSTPPRFIHIDTYWSDPRLSITLTRFSTCEIKILLHYLGLENASLLDMQSNSKKVDAYESLHILFHHLSHGHNCILEGIMYGMYKTSICGIINSTARIIYERSSRLVDLDSRVIVPRIMRYIDAINEKCRWRRKIWVFLDGKFIFSTRPSENQREFYSGEKKSHGIRYELIVSPDGLIQYCSNPVNGSQNDALAVYTEQIEGKLMQLSNESNMAVFVGADKGYANRGLVASPIRNRINGLNQEEEEFNAKLSSARISVEWGINLVVSRFKFFSMWYKIRSKKEMLDRKFKIAVFLTNCITCMDGSNIISDYFGLKPMSIQEYLSYMQ